MRLRQVVLLKHTAMRDHSDKAMDYFINPKKFGVRHHADGVGEIGAIAK